MFARTLSWWRTRRPSASFCVDYLGKHNFRVSGAEDGVGLRRLVERELPALVLLDVGLPGEDGFALARWLREKSGRIGIIMVTVASDTVDRVVGLETGADDYIAKPFEARELLARVKSVLRRVTGAAPSTGPRVRMGRRVLDLEKRVLCDAGDDSEEALAASEFDLLKVFRGEPQPAAQSRLAAGGHRASGDGGLRPVHRPAHRPPAPQDRARSGASDRHPHRARRRLHVRAAQGLTTLERIASVYPSSRKPGEPDYRDPRRDRACGSPGSRCKHRVRDDGGCVR